MTASKQTENLPTATIRRSAPERLVTLVMDAIVEATATGVFLPGDRVVEAEVARQLNVSRVPVREALRMLESQGIVVSERYRGMRLMDVNIDRLEKILKVRLVLEVLAGREIMAQMKENPGVIAPLRAIVAKLHEVGDRGEVYQVAHFDTEFHHELCKLSGNEALVQAWEPLSRQLTIIFGLATMQKKITAIVEEHDEVIDALERGNVRSFERLMKKHILDYSRAIDYEGLVDRLRRLTRKGRKVEQDTARGLSPR